MSITAPEIWVCALVLALIPAASGCVSTPSEEATTSIAVGGVYQDEEAGLATTERGDFMVTLSYIASPTEVRLNPRYPRTMRFVGVEAPDLKRDPETYKRALDAVQDHAGRYQLLFVRPQVGTNPRAEIIWGRILIPLNEQSEQFRDLTMAMLEEGLLRISDEREFQDPKVVELMRAAEKKAKDARRGVWRRA